MKKFFGKIKNFFVELRKKPENVRQIWLWVFVSGSLLIIFIVWIFIFKSHTPTIAVIEPTPSPAVEDNSNGVINILKIGWEKTWDFIKEKVKDIGGFLGNMLAGFFSYIFQTIRKVAKVFDGVNNYLEGEFAAYFKSLGSLISGEF